MHCIHLKENVFVLAEDGVFLCSNRGQFIIKKKSLSTGLPLYYDYFSYQQDARLFSYEEVGLLNVKPQSPGD